MDSWVPSASQLLWIMLLWNWVCKYLFETLLSILLGIYPEMELWITRWTSSLLSIPWGSHPVLHLEIYLLMTSKFTVPAHIFPLVSWLVYPTVYLYLYISTGIYSKHLELDISLNWICKFSPQNLIFLESSHLMTTPSFYLLHQKIWSHPCLLLSVISQIQPIRKSCWLYNNKFRTWPLLSATPVVQASIISPGLLQQPMSRSPCFIPAPPLSKSISR